MATLDPTLPSPNFSGYHYLGFHSGTKLVRRNLSLGKVYSTLVRIHLPLVFLDNSPKLTTLNTWVRQVSTANTEQQMRVGDGHGPR